MLVVDDELLVQELMQAALEDGGFAVQTASSDDEAIAALEKSGPAFAAVVTDVNLGRPGAGWNVARRARELNATIPVLFVTGDSEHEWTVNGVPGSAILPKPFAPAQLVVAVATLINSAASSLSS